MEEHAILRTNSNHERVPGIRREGPVDGVDGFASSLPSSFYFADIHYRNPMALLHRALSCDQLTGFQEAGFLITATFIFEPVGRYSIFINPKGTGAYTGRVSGLIMLHQCTGLAVKREMVGGRDDVTFQAYIQSENG